MNYSTRILKKVELGKLKHLWQLLNELHLQDSPHFKEHYRNFTFEARCEVFSQIEEKDLRIEIIEDNEDICGYCISTIKQTTGEIDSLFIEEKYRMYGYGQLLMENSTAWLKERKCKKIIVGVAAGHESVFGFYQKLGFYPQMTYLQLKE